MSKSIKTLLSQIKNYMIQHEKLKKERKIERLERAIEREDSEEKLRREMLLKRRSNVRRNHSWLIETAPAANSSRRLY